MDFNKFIFNNYTESDEYEHLVEKAKSVDVDSTAPQLDLAYAIYLKSTEAHNSYAERRLGSMCINGEGTEKDFNRGVGFYLMAAEDGDEYSKIMLQAIIPQLDISVLDEANRGHTSSMQELAKLYFSYGKNYERAYEWCAKAVLRGDVFSAITLVYMLTFQDLSLYLEHPNYSEKFYQDNEWKNLAIKHFDNTAIYDEVLLVNSASRIQQIFDILKYLMTNYSSNHELMNSAINCFLALVNSSNSFHRCYDLSVDKKIINIAYPLFSNSWIKQFVSNQNTLSKGIELHRNNKIVNHDIYKNTYSARVLGTGGKVYSPRFNINSIGLISEVHCDCLAFQKYDGVCKHIVALFYKLQEEDKRYSIYRNTSIPEYTSVTGSTMIGGNDNNLFIYHLEGAAYEKYIKVILTMASYIFNSSVEKYSSENVSFSEFAFENHTAIIARSERNSRVIIGYIPLGEIGLHTDSLKENMADAISRYV